MKAIKSLKSKIALKSNKIYGGWGIQLQALWKRGGAGTLCELKARTNPRPNSCEPIRGSDESSSWSGATNFRQPQRVCHVMCFPTYGHVLPYLTTWMTLLVHTLSRAQIFPRFPIMHETSYVSTNIWILPFKFYFKPWSKTTQTSTPAFETISSWVRFANLTMWSGGLVLIDHERTNHRLCRHHTTTSKQGNENEQEQMNV